MELKSTTRRSLECFLATHLVSPILIRLLDPPFLFQQLTVSMAKKILIVEDDRSLASVLEYNFESAGYQVFCAHDGQDGINQARSKQPDMILLDLMVPVVDGVEVCRQLRSESRTRDTPLRRNERSKSGGSDIVTSGGIEIDRLKHRASVHGQPIDLTPSEFRLLDTLIRNPGRAFDRSELIELALGGDTLVLERTIDVHIRSLRKKIGDMADFVQTVRGVGYRFRETSG